MHPKRRQKLALIGLLVLGVGAAVGLTLFALKQNINLYYDASAVARGEAPVGPSFRLGGLVVVGSVQRDPASLKVEFRLTDCEREVPVRFSGILPDLFREGQGIIAMGRLGADGVVEASEVLAKHDENYMPPEVASSMKDVDACRAAQQAMSKAMGTGS